MPRTDPAHAATRPTSRPISLLPASPVRAPPLLILMRCCLRFWGQNLHFWVPCLLFGCVAGVWEASSTSYAMPGTDLANGATCLRECYAMSGTDLAYGSTMHDDLRATHLDPAFPPHRRQHGTSLLRNPRETSAFFSTACTRSAVVLNTRL
eukprot:3625806-Rhodomonas_salina.1